jgi:hypothetical protein
VLCSLSNRWNVARLTSAISSSFRTRRCSDQLSSDCGTSAAGSVDADALPASESPSPTAPSAVAAAALVVLCSLPACFLRAMVVSFDTLGSSSHSGAYPTSSKMRKRRRRFLFPRAFFNHRLTPPSAEPTEGLGLQQQPLGLPGRSDGWPRAPASQPSTARRARPGRQCPILTHGSATDSNHVVVSSMLEVSDGDRVMRPTRWRPPFVRWHP